MTAHATPGPQAAAAPGRLVLGAPAYFYPGRLWSTALEGAPAVRYLIANPDSGPGVRRVPEYADVVASAQAAGVRVLGYVHTSWGRRPRSEVLAEVAGYRDWYGVTDIFLDEAATSSEVLPYYRDLAAVVHGAPGAVLALNPGTVPDERYASVADLLVVFEGSYSAYRTWSPPAWQVRHPRSTFWHLVYATDRSDLPGALRAADLRGAGVVFVTDGRLDNPWNRLPSYWTGELDLLRKLNPAAPRATTEGAVWDRSMTGSSPRS